MRPRADFCRKRPVDTAVADRALNPRHGWFAQKTARWARLGIEQQCEVRRRDSRIATSTTSRTCCDSAVGRTGRQQGASTRKRASAIGFEHDRGDASARLLRLVAQCVVRDAAVCAPLRVPRTDEPRFNPLDFRRSP